MTAGELENALGNRTGRTVSRTKDAHDIGFGGGSTTRSTEDRPLLSRQEIRDMDPEKIIILPERQNPILANRIKYYASKEIRAIHASQENRDYPFPQEDADHKPVTMEAVREIAAAQHAHEAEQAHDEKVAFEQEKPPETSDAKQKRIKVAFNDQPNTSPKLAPGQRQQVKELSTDCSNILDRWNAEFG